MYQVKDKFEINKPHFTDSDMKIYNAIQEYPGIIERYTVSQLSEQLDISTASVMRFAKKLGYSGYSEFRFEYMRELHATPEEENSTTIISQYVSLITKSFEAFNQIDEQQFIQLAKEIDTHKRVFALGIGKTGLVCNYLSYCFVRTGKYIEPINDYVMVRDIAKSSKNNDLFIIFSEKASPTSRLIPEVLHSIKSSSKAKIIIVTCNPGSSLLQTVDGSIILPSIDVTQEGIRTHSIMLGFIDILLSYYLVRKK